MANSKNQLSNFSTNDYLDNLERENRIDLNLEQAKELVRRSRSSIPDNVAMDLIEHLAIDYSTAFIIYQALKMQLGIDLLMTPKKMNNIEHIQTDSMHYFYYEFEESKVLLVKVKIK